MELTLTFEEFLGCQGTLRKLNGLQGLPLADMFLIGRRHKVLTDAFQEEKDILQKLSKEHQDLNKHRKALGDNPPPDDLAQLDEDLADLNERQQGLLETAKTVEMNGTIELAETHDFVPGDVLWLDKLGVCPKGVKSKG